MRILYINHYAGSPNHGMEYRPYYLAREWVRCGHEVRIVAADRSHLRIQQPELGDQCWLNETISEVEYTWLRTSPYVSNGFDRVRNIGSFLYRLYADGKRLAAEFKPTVVIASSTYPMDIWPAHRIAKLSSAKLVFEIHDLWPLTPIELGGMSRLHPFIVVARSAESYVYRHVGSVVSVLPNVHGYLQSRQVELDRLHIVPNGVDPEEWPVKLPRLAASVEATLRTIAESGSPIVGYAGNHGISNSLDTLLEAAKIMRDEKISFVLVGSGPEKNRLKQWAQIEQLRNVYFLDPVEKRQIPALLQWFDVAYIGWRRQGLYRFGIAPNKLMDYMMAGRPVLHAVEAGNDPVGEAGCGLTVRPECPEAAVTGIRHLVSLSIGERKAMGARGKEFILKHHTYPVLGRRFLSACA